MSGLLKARVLVQFQLPACFRSEGPAFSSPVREGRVDPMVSCLSAEGAPRLVPALRASDDRGQESPPSRTGLLTTGPSDPGVHIEPVSKTRHLLSTRTTFLLVLFCIVVAANSPNLTAQIEAQTKPAPSPAVTEALQTSFGSAVDAARAFQPFYLTGDFNGDGAQDILIVVWIKGRKNDLPQGVRVSYPFNYGAAATFPSSPASKPTLGLAIIHGTKAGWKSPQNAGKFLLVGESPILILEKDRGLSTHSQDRLNLMEIMSRRGKRRRGASWPPAVAKGDSILLPTEATDSILYWNGKTYRWEESSDAE